MISLMSLISTGRIFDERPYYLRDVSAKKNDFGALLTAKVIESITNFATTVRQTVLLQANNRVKVSLIFLRNGIS